MRIRGAIIHRGYAEENSMAGTPVWHIKGFNSVEELLAALGTAVTNAYWQEKIRKSCCERALKKKPSYRHCPTCGNTLKREIGKKEGIDYCWQFLSGTCDSIGTAWEEIEGAGWDFGCTAWTRLFREDCFVVVHSYGAELLWYCSRGEAATRSHAEEGGSNNTPYSSVLKAHCEVGLRKSFAEDATVHLYKEKR